MVSASAGKVESARAAASQTASRHALQVATESSCVDLKGSSLTVVAHPFELRDRYSRVANGELAICRCPEPAYASQFIGQSPRGLSCPSGTAREPIMRLQEPSTPTWPASTDRVAAQRLRNGAAVSTGLVISTMRRTGQPRLESPLASAEEYEAMAKGAEGDDPGWRTPRSPQSSTIRSRPVAQPVSGPRSSLPFAR
jgi:hypothetical protein